MKHLLILALTFPLLAHSDIIAPKMVPKVKAATVTSGAGTVEFSENYKSEQDNIIRTVEGKLPQIEKCYASALKKNAGISGQILVKWDLNPAGLPTSASVQKNGVRNWNLNSCIMNRFKTWNFPKTSDGKPGSITYSFDFKTEEALPPDTLGQKTTK